MRRAVEKLSWLVLSMALASVIAFAALARLSDVAIGRVSEVPLLVNLAPRNARDLALEGVRAVAKGGGESQRGAAALVRLGGAGLPHVLGTLDALDPVTRGRVALAILPIAQRMGLEESHRVVSAEQALVFWTRFWQDRSADFRSAVVRRKVQRLADRALALRQKEVLELDTFAIPELIDAIGRVTTPADVGRVERLAPALNHATGIAWELRPDATVPEAAAFASRWRRWALEHRLDFTTLDGPGRLTAVITETRYFRWLRTLIAAGGDRDAATLSRVAATLREARNSLALAAFCLVAGVLLGAAAATRSSHVSRARRAVELTGLALACVPATFLALRAIGLGKPGVVLVIVLATAAFVAYDAASEPVPARYRDVAWRAGLHAGPLFATIVAALLGAEALVGRAGLGTLIRVALGAGDLDALMLAALPIALAGLVAATVAAAAAVYRPAMDRSGSLVWPSRSRVVAALIPVTLLACCALAGPWLGSGLTPLATALRSLLFAVLVVTAVATLVALTLGFLAGMVARSADVILARAYEVKSALPAALVMGALLTLGGGLGLVLLGILRGVELAFLFRTRLAEGRAVLELEPLSLGRTPILPHLARLLPAAARQPLASLFLTASWLFGLALSAFAMGAPPPAALVPIRDPSGPAGSFAAAAIALLGAALFALLARAEHDDEGPGAPVLALNRRVDRDSSTQAG
jgi:hypothetical protein